MIVVADTSPLNYLIRLGHPDVLQKIYGRVLVPRAVLIEMQHPEAPSEVRAWASAPPVWIEERQVQQIDGSLAAELGARKFTNNSMADFALGMQSFLDRLVVDETGLTGKYDFVLKWTPDETNGNDPHEAPGIFTAVQEQLGLKLEPTKGPADVLVIDHVERPSEN